MLGGTLRSAGGLRIRVLMGILILFPVVPSVPLVPWCRPALILTWGVIIPKYMFYHAPVTRISCMRHMPTHVIPMSYPGRFHRKFTSFSSKISTYVDKRTQIPKYFSPLLTRNPWKIVGISHKGFGTYSERRKARIGAENFDGFHFSRSVCEKLLPA